MHTPAFFGRQHEGRAVILSAQAGRSVVLVAPPGYGKSALLAEIQPALDELAASVQIQKLAPFGTFVTDLFTALHAAGLGFPETEPADPLKAWKKANSGIDQKGRSLVAALKRWAALGCTPPVIVIDDATGITQSMVPWLLALSDHAALVLAVQPETMRRAGLGRWWSRCDRVDLQPLSKAESKQLVEQLSQQFGIVAQDKGAYRNRVLSMSEGVPGEILRLVRYASAHDLVTPHDMGSSFAQQAAVRQERGMALWPFILAGGGLAMVTKYVGLARGEMDMYLAGGIGIAVFAVAGPWLRKLMVAR